MEYCDSVCAINSVSRVACISAARVYEGRELNAFRRDVEICVSKCVRTMVSNGDGVVDGERLAPEDTEDGIVVEISVWTSTSVSKALYT